METVAGAMGDADLAGFVRHMMLEDISPTLNPEAGIDYPAYVDAILARFANPGIRHLLSQIAWDGSAKLPFRLFGTITERLAAGASGGSAGPARRRLDAVLCGPRPQTQAS